MVVGLQGVRVYVDGELCSLEKGLKGGYTPEHERSGSQEEC